jgi:hypothetical protein
MNPQLVFLAGSRAQTETTEPVLGLDQFNLRDGVRRSFHDLPAEPGCAGAKSVFDKPVILNRLGSEPRNRDILAFDEVHCE